ncbi:hypothetical protein RDV89_13045 [Nocardioides zeae]|uniref:Integral membrane protein n=1 Tax=Nocardioides imazamoxiresistens TaxID=3231893 RepID=A0ABU3PXP1_9ACTN|nr:hypothetical protein [Nocardioides zeae]MDT9594002.1 hypothetical protein [Nocardioides zeae]
MTSIGWGLRLVRGTVLAVVVLLAGVAGHALAGGALPAAGTLLALLPPFAAAGALLLARRADAWETALLLALGQGALHLALMLLAPAGHAAHGAHGAHASYAAGSPLPMLALHLAAAGVGGWWLAAGERALVTLTDLAVVRPTRRALHAFVRALLAHLRPPAPLRPTRPIAPTSATPARLRCLTTRRCLPPRAPPLVRATV